MSLKGPAVAFVKYYNYHLISILAFQFNKLIFGDAVPDYVMYFIIGLANCGKLFGAIVMGRVSDLHGKDWTFRISLFLSICAIAIFAFLPAWGYISLLLFILARFVFVTSFSSGSDAARIMMFEQTKKYKGLYLSTIGFAVKLAIAVVYLILLLLNSSGVPDYAWRASLLFGLGLNIMLYAFVRRSTRNLAGSGAAVFWDACRNSVNAKFVSRKVKYIILFINMTIFMLKAVNVMTVGWVQLIVFMFCINIIIYYIAYKQSELEEDMLKIILSIIFAGLVSSLAQFDLILLPRLFVSHYQLPQESVYMYASINSALSAATSLLAGLFIDLSGSILFVFTLGFMGAFLSVMLFAIYGYGLVFYLLFGISNSFLVVSGTYVLIILPTFAKYRVRYFSFVHACGSVLISSFMAGVLGFVQNLYNVSAMFYSFSFILVVFLLILIYFVYCLKKYKNS